MTLDQLLSGVNTKHAFLLGGIAIAHSERKRARDNLKEAEKSKEAAIRENRTMGIYEDCGDFYQSLVDRAEGAERRALAEKVSKEKHFKKLCHEYEEAGGDPHTIALLQAILNEQT
jgi:hypothetical protein